MSTLFKKLKAGLEDAIVHSKGKIDLRTHRDITIQKFISVAGLISAPLILCVIKF